MKHPAKPYWFSAKTHGYGWGLPIKWQGWASLAGFGIILALVTRYLLGSMRNEMYPVRTIVMYVIIVTVDTVAMLALCYKFGAPAKWRWGK